MTWQSQEWKEKASAFVQGKSCSWCGATENLVPHHPKKRFGYTHQEYMNVEQFCIPLCRTCNFMESKGCKLCPICKKRYYKSKRNHSKLCWNCFLLGRQKAGIANIFLGLFVLTAVAFSIFLIYIALTPAVVSYFNNIEGLILGPWANLVGTGGQTAILKMINQSVTIWALLFLIAFIGTSATIYVIAYRDEPVEQEF